MTSVSIRTTMSSFSVSIVFFISASISSRLGARSARSMTSIWPTPALTPLKSNFLKSPKTISFAVLDFISLLALSISMPNFCGSSPHILDSFSTVALSLSVQVGDLKSTVSLRMAAIIRPAISFVIGTPLSSYMLAMMVPVAPTGSLWKNIGFPVWMSPILWWSTISRISAFIMLSTAWPISL